MQAHSIDLDDLASYEIADPSQMRKHIAAFPDRIIHGWDGAAPTELPASYRKASGVVVQGMGGSAIAGDIASEALGSLSKTGDAPLPEVARDYGAHAGVGPDTLVIALSHSGYTEEVLSGVEASLKRGAHLIALTSGGPLATIAAERNLPRVTMPSEGGPPRASLPDALGALLRILWELGIAPKETPDALKVAVDELRLRQAEFAPSCNSAGLGPTNPAKDMALALADKAPVIVGARGFMSAARRWKTQINENAKTPAWTEELPEMHHNAVVGFERPGAVQNTAVVLLGPPGPDADARLYERYVITRDVLTELNVPVLWPALAGSSALSRLLEAVLLGDYVSYYLALVNGIDPIPTKTLDKVKTRIRGVLSAAGGSQKERD